MIGEEHQRLAAIFAHRFDSPQQVRAFILGAQAGEPDGLYYPRYTRFEAKHFLLEALRSWTAPVRAA